jgi:hypothetical protein
MSQMSVGDGGEQNMKLSQYANSSGGSTSLKHLDKEKSFSIIKVEDSNYEEIKGVKITTEENFDIEGDKHNQFHTTRVAIVSQLSNPELRSGLTSLNPLVVKIGTKNSAGGKPYFVLEDVE